MEIRLIFDCLLRLKSEKITHSNLRHQYKYPYLFRDNGHTKGLFGNKGIKSNFQYVHFLRTNIKYYYDILFYKNKR